jgi:hypothetical protein
VGLYVDNQCPSDIDNADNDYNAEGLYMLMICQEGQDNLFGRHDER